MKPTHPKVYCPVKKSERISKIVKKKLLEKTKIPTSFDSNINRDGIKEEKVAKIVIRVQEGGGRELQSSLVG